MSDPSRPWDQTDADNYYLAEENRVFRGLLKRYLDSHCLASDQGGCSVLCECTLCKETRKHLGLAVLG